MREKQLNNSEVFVSDDQIVKTDCQDMAFLKERVIYNQRKRIRLCTHKDVDDTLHEMIIVLMKDTYIRPHKHLNKSESFHIIEGYADVIIFDDAGNIIEVVQMGDYISGNKFYYRISHPYYHTPLIISDYLVFHETTNGPFRKADAVFAPWAPDEDDDTAGKEYMKELFLNVENFTSLNEKNLCKKSTV